MSREPTPKPEIRLLRLGNGEYAGRIIERVPCSSELAWQRLRQLESLDRLIPFCESSTTRLLADGATELTVAVGLPWPFPQIHYVVRAELDDAERTVRWERLEGNLKRNDGSLRFEAAGAGLAIAHYSCTVGVGFHVPRVAEAVMERFILPRVMGGFLANIARHCPD